MDCFFGLGLFLQMIGLFQKILKNNRNIIAKHLKINTYILHYQQYI